MDDTTRTLPPSLTSEALAEWLTLKDRALDVAAEGITIADARLPDRPLIYVNEGFQRMTGYAVDEVLGRNCRFLQGTSTDADATAEIRAALSGNRACVVEILNHRKDGTPFWNRLSITPVADAAGDITHFIGIQSDVTARRTAEEGLRRSKAAMEHDLRMAARVQQSLLPPPEVDAGGVRLAHAFNPCDDLAGDSVGIIPLGHDCIGLYVLDVSGHGVGASLLSFTLTHLLSPHVGGVLLAEGGASAPSVVPPPVVAERLNRQFPMDRTRQYFTLVYGTIEPSSGRFRYVTAGHPSPVLLPAAGSPVLVPGSGLPIGMIEGAAYDEEALVLQPGDRLYFYTDGAMEALDSHEEEFGLERLLSEFSRWRHLPLRAGLEQVAASVRAWCHGQVKDDISLLAVERRA